MPTMSDRQHDTHGDGWRILCGDALDRLREIPQRSLKMVATDPPYSSGGMYRADKTVATGRKYGTEHLPSFAGDAKTQMTHLHWCALWMALCRGRLEPGGYLLCFCDWRQVGVTQMALQSAGFQERGLIPWDKKSGRVPGPGYFKNQCEFIVWGTRGKLLAESGAYPGVITCSPVHHSKRNHPAEKPLPVWEHLFQPLSPGDRVLDCFCGGGSSGHQARLDGLVWTGIEIEPSTVAVAAQRLESISRNPEVA